MFLFWAILLNFENASIILRFIVFIKETTMSVTLKILSILLCAMLIACGGDSSDDAVPADDSDIGTVDDASDTDDTDTEPEEADEDDSTTDSDEDIPEESDDVPDEDAETEEIQTGGIYIFSSFDETGNAESREILGNGGFFGFSIMTLSEKYWAVSAIHESIPAFDWDKATGKLYIFEKEKKVGKLEDAAFVLNHPEKSLNVGFGYTAAELCDINGDGFDDLAVSSHLAAFGDLYAAGEIVVFYGSSDGWNEENSSISRLSSAYIQRSDSMSQSLVCLDYDGDGFSDVFAGGQNAGPELEGGGSQGMVAMFKGSAAGLSEHEDSVLLPEVDEKAQYFGSGMLALDLNGDKRQDLIVAGWGLKESRNAANSGGIYVYLGGEEWFEGASEKFFGTSGSQFGSMVKVVEIAGKKYIGVLATKEEKYGAIHIYETENFNEIAVIAIPEIPGTGDGNLSDFDTVKISENSDLLIAGGKTFSTGGMIFCSKTGNGEFGNVEKCAFQPDSPEGGFGYSVKNIGNGEIVVGKPEYVHRF